MLSEYRLDKYWTWLLWCFIHSPPMEPCSTPGLVFPYPSDAHPTTTTKKRPPPPSFPAQTERKFQILPEMQIFFQVPDMLKPSTPHPLLTASPADQDVLRMCHLSHHSKQMVFHSTAPPLSTLLNTRAYMWRWQEGRKGMKERVHPHLNLRNI